MLYKISLTWYTGRMFLLKFLIKFHNKFLAWVAGSNLGWNNEEFQSQVGVGATKAFGNSFSVNMFEAPTAPHARTCQIKFEFFH